MIARVEEIERRLARLTDENRALRDRLRALDDRLMQLGGAMGGLFGPSGVIAFGRAVGAIDARTGTTLGTGDFHFADVSSSGVLTEGADPTNPCYNLIDFDIADNAWLLLVKPPQGWTVIGVGAPCTDLTAP